MANWEFYDNSEDVEGSEDNEPSFSLYDFKKWLSSQKQKPLGSFREGIEENKKITEEKDKENLKKSFKNRVNTRVNKNIEKKITERKKKKS